LNPGQDERPDSCQASHFGRWLGHPPPPQEGCLSLLGPQAKQAADPVAVATGQFRPITVQGFSNFIIS
jgi:hypothetical protein